MKGRRALAVMAVVFVIMSAGFGSVSVAAQWHAEETASLEPKEGAAGSDKDSLTGALTRDMDFTQVQKLVDELLGQDSFSFSEAFHGLISGKEVFSKEAVQEFLHGLFFDRIEQERSNFVKILLLVLLAALFANFAAVFENGQIGEVSFYMVYLLLFVLLMDSFSQLSRTLSHTLAWMTDFMKSLSPAYFLAVAAANGGATAAVFYQGVLLLVWLIQWILLTILLPGANLYILLCLINHLSREEMLSKMAELLESFIGWGLKTLLGLVVGLQVVKGLIAPVMDSLKRTALGKTAGAIPGVGNAVNMVTELVVTTAVLVRNSLGVVVLAVLVLAGARPLIHLGMLSLAYRFLGALAEPVSDKRIVGCLSTMGEGCAILLRILLTAEGLCMVSFVILAAGGGGV